MKIKPKIIVIGIDGGDLKIINPLIKEGKLPNIQKVFGEGSSNLLESSILPSSEQAWSSFSTGCNNGKHGIYSYIQRVNKDYNSFKLVDGSFFKGKRFWDVLGEHNKKSIIINVTATYPPKELNGVLITCRLTPNKNVEYTYPPNIKEEIEKIAPDYITKIPDPKCSKKNTKAWKSYVNKVYKRTSERGKIARYLINNHEWDLFVLVFDYTDFIQHIFWADFFKKDSEYNYVIPKLYQSIDNEIGNLLSEIKEDYYLILMSDHGFSYRRKRVNFNSWLNQRGYMVYNQEKIYNIRRKILRGIHKIIPHKIEQYIKKNFFNQILSTAYSHVDWENTKAFSVGSGGICINLKGREPKGSVSKEDYENIRNELIKELKNLKDPKTKLRVIKKVYKREEIYHGNYLDDAPDIVNLLEDGYKPDLFKTQNEVFTEEYRGTGNHSLYGFFAIKGRGIKNNKKYNHPFRIIDIAPTVFYLMNIPIPKYIDGKVLTNIFKK